MKESNNKKKNVSDVVYVCVLSVWVQPGDEASLLCQRDHTQPQQQKPEVWSMNL